MKMMKTSRMNMMETSGLKTNHPNKTNTWVEEVAAISWLKKLTCDEDVVAGSWLKKLTCIEDVVVVGSWLEKLTCSGTVCSCVAARSEAELLRDIFCFLWLGCFEFLETSRSKAACGTVQGDGLAITLGCCEIVRGGGLAITLGCCETVQSGGRPAITLGCETVQSGHTHSRRIHIYLFDRLPVFEKLFD